MYHILRLFARKPLFTFTLFAIILCFALYTLTPLPFSQTPLHSTINSSNESDIWSAKRVLSWRPCQWWLRGITDNCLPLDVPESNGYIRIDCYGGLNQIRRDFCNGIGIARLLNATLVLPKFEVTDAFWNESSRFKDVFDVDIFIEYMSDLIEVVKEVPEEIASKEPVRVELSKHKGQFDYVESVLPSLLKHHYISITPVMSQRRDRLPLYAKAAFCRACYLGLRLNKTLEKKASKLLEDIPYEGLLKMLFWNRKVFVEFSEHERLNGKELMEVMRKAREDDFVMGRGFALSDCFCE